MADSDVTVQIGAVANVRPAVDQSLADVGALSAGVRDVASQIADYNSKAAASFYQIGAEAQAAARQANTAMVSMGSGARDAGAALRTVSTAAHGSTTALREMVVMLHEASQGRWNRLAGSMMVMAEYSGQLAAIMSPLGAAIGGVLAVLGATAYAAYRGAEEWRRFEGAIAATNNAAGLSGSGFLQMSQQIAAATHTGIGPAREALTGLILNSHLTGRALLLAGENAITMGRLTGEGADKFIAEFARMGDDVAKFAADYQAKYHQLTAAQYEEIRALQEQGDTAQATLRLMEDLHGYLGTTAVDHLSALGRAWHEVGEEISRAWEAMKGFGREATPTEKLQEVNRQIKDLQAGDRAHPGALFGGGSDRQLRGLELQRAVLQGLADGETKAAAAQQKFTETQREGTAAAGRLDSSYVGLAKNADALRQRIAEINQDRAKAIAADPAHADQFNREADAEIADAKRKAATHTPKVKNVPSALEALRAQLDEELNTMRANYGEREEIVRSFWQRVVESGKLSGQMLNEAKHELVAANIAVDKEGFEEKLAQDRFLIQQAKDAPEAYLQAWDRYVADVGTRYAADTREFKDALRQRLEAQQEMVREQRAQQAQAVEAASQRGERGERSSAQSGSEAIDAREHGLQDQREDGAVGGRQYLSELRSLEAERAALEEASAERIYQIAVAAQEKLKRLPGTTVNEARAADEAEKTAFEQMQDAKVAAAQKAAKRIEEAEADAAKRTQQTWKQNIGQVVDSFGQGMLSMARGTMTFRQAMLNVAETIENQMVKAVEDMVTKMITNFIFGQTQQKAVNDVAAIGAITDNAAVAASAAFAAAAGIPGVAEAAAAAAFQETMAWGSLVGASAAGGYDIPAGVNPIVQTHAKEMILPASIAEGFRSIISGQKGGSGGPLMGGGGRGDVNMTFAPQALDTRSFARYMDNPANMRALARAVTKHIRP